MTSMLDCWEVGLGVCCLGLGFRSWGLQFRVWVRARESMELIAAFVLQNMPQHLGFRF